MTLEVVRSEVRVISSPSYMPLSKFSPAGIHTLFGSFFKSAVVNYDHGICYDSVLVDIFNAPKVEESHCVRPLGVIC